MTSIGEDMENWNVLVALEYSLAIPQKHSHMT